MGFKLPGKSITSGTSAHSSALKMKEKADAASALKQMTLTREDMKGTGYQPPGGPKGTIEVSATGSTYSSTKTKGKHVKIGNTPGAKAVLESRWKKGDKTSGGTLNELVKQRKGLDKGSTEYAAIQNQINKALGSKKVHTGTATTTKPTKTEKVIKKQEGKVDKATIAVTKQEGKLAAKQPESDKGTRISTQERAQIKEPKLKGKVVSDVTRDKKGLGSKIRKYRAARKAKKNIKKYGTPA
tara:strand:+ start:68 stop:790 length:723 start_codon:yes stop_codon:yes gene_type:complete